MHIRELTSATGATERQIRYLITEGFMPPPRGGRANADYGNDHLEAINRYNRLRDLGFPPAAIKLLLETEAGVPFCITPGITVTIAPKLLSVADAEVETIVAQVESGLRQILKGASNG